MLGFCFGQDLFGWVRGSMSTTLDLLLQFTVTWLLS